MSIQEESTSLDAMIQSVTHAVSDESDRASAEEMFHTMLALKALENRPQDVLPHGKCNWCGEETEGAFCDEFCREDWEKQKWSKSQQPRV